MIQFVFFFSQRVFLPNTTSHRTQLHPPIPQQPGAGEGGELGQLPPLTGGDGGPQGDNPSHAGDDDKDYHMFTLPPSSTTVVTRSRYGRGHQLDFTYLHFLDYAENVPIMLSYPPNKLYYVL